jgi:uncharacterized protein YbjT (DUF2867 family)
MFVIAGVTGHVGAVVADELLAKKQQIKVIVRNAAKGAAWSKKGAEVAVGSLDDPAFLAGALRGAAGFFTLLPPPNFQDTDFYGAQRKTADAIAGAVKISGVPYVVLLSSVGADLPTGTGPIRGLHYLENALRTTGVQLTAIRACYFQENLAGSLAPARQQGIFPNFTSSADHPRAMVATRDIGTVAAQALLTKPAKSEVVDLQGPAYSQRQLAEKLGDALGKKLKIVDIPESGWIPAMTQGGMPQHVAEVFAEMYRGFGSGTIKPKGDRMVQGQTQIDAVIKALVA